MDSWRPNRIRGHASALRIAAHGAVLLLLATACVRCAHQPPRPAIIEPPEPVALELPEPPANARPGQVWAVAGIDMVYIPPGTFTMGSPRGEPERDPEDERQRVVTLEGFWLSRCEISQAQWTAVMGHGLFGPEPDFKAPERPMDSVSWDDCQRFVSRLNRGTDGAFRLPTQSEWEYACRAGTVAAFHFGNTIHTDLANYNGTTVYARGRRGVYRETTVPVATFPPNPWGLHDMHGNLWEWCQDVYGVVYDSARNGGVTLRAVRGGGWLSEPMSCRAAYSYGLNQDTRRNFVGLRLCRSHSGAQEGARLAAR